MITVGADSYVTIAEANAYFSRLLDSAEWDSATEATKEKALKNATLNIDKLTYINRKSNINQALQFPLTHMNGIPQEVKFATCEEALSLLKGGYKRQELIQDGVKSISNGDASETYIDGFTVHPVSPKSIQYLRKFIVGSVAIC